MIKYFIELLTTLKNIERHLCKLASCVQESRKGFGDRYSISSKHWND